MRRRTISIHMSKSVPLQMHLDSAHKLKQLSFSSSMNGDSKQDDEWEGEAPREALIYMEISRHTDPQLLQDLVLAVQDVLKDVATAVADFQPLLSATEELESSLSRVSQLPLSQMEIGRASCRERGETAVWA